MIFKSLNTRNLDQCVKLVMHKATGFDFMFENDIDLHMLTYN